MSGAWLVQTEPALSYLAGLSCWGTVPASSNVLPWDGHGPQRSFLQSMAWRKKVYFFLRALWPQEKMMLHIRMGL